jgi:inosine-uridine nucleoside N-ribohydrolase
MMAEKVILDVDTGSDDTIAIMAAVLSRDIELLGITTVNGNRNVDITTENTLRVVDLLETNIPVYKGCHLPMVSTLLKGRRDNVPFRGPENKEEDVHGDYLPATAAQSKPQPEHAVLWLVNTLANTKEKITLIFVGPLTNLAMALRINPQITANIKEIIIMGGGYLINNITSGAEFNFWVDPEAAKIVMDCGTPIRLVPLDATHVGYITAREAEEIRSIGTPAAKLCADLILKRLEGYRKFQPLDASDGVPIHDALAVCALLDPEVLNDLMEVHVDISFSPGITDGMSLCDVGRRNKDLKPNAIVAQSANREKFVEMLTAIFRGKL